LMAQISEPPPSKRWPEGVAEGAPEAPPLPAVPPLLTTIALPVVPPLFKAPPLATVPPLFTAPPLATEPPEAKAVAVGVPLDTGVGALQAGMGVEEGQCSQL